MVFLRLPLPLNKGLRPRIWNKINLALGFSLGQLILKKSIHGYGF